MVKLVLIEYVKKVYKLNPIHKILIEFDHGFSQIQPTNTCSHHPRVLPLPFSLVFVIHKNKVLFSYLFIFEILFKKFKGHLGWFLILSFDFF